MQTFLPYSNFKRVGECLDSKRLGNQVYRECKTLINGGWKHHPASKMWIGYEFCLCSYALELAKCMPVRLHWNPEVCSKWKEYWLLKRQEFTNTGVPPWLGDSLLHASHRSNLLRKDPGYYSSYGWTENDNLPYFWPTYTNEREKRSQQILYKLQLSHS